MRALVSSFGLVLLAAVACSSPGSDLPPGMQSGAELYQSQRCALCHGADGSSAFWRPGPDLLPHLASWTVDDLSEYLGDTDAVAARVERLTPGKMASVEGLDEAQLRRLAGYVLTLAKSDDG